TYRFGLISFQQKALELIRHDIRLKSRGRQFPILIRKLCRRSQFRSVQTPTACRAAFDLVKFIDEGTEIAPTNSRLHDRLGPGVVRIVDAISPPLSERRRY